MCKVGTVVSDVDEYALPRWSVGTRGESLYLRASVRFFLFPNNEYTINEIGGPSPPYLAFSRAIFT